MVRHILAGVALFAGFTLSAVAQEDRDPAGNPVRKAVKLENNKNALIKQFRQTLKLEASSSYGGWPIDNVLDGRLQTSWFSSTGDSVAAGSSPWIKITFPRDVTVSRVTIAGNRDPAYPTGYFVLRGKMEFFDATGKKLWSEEMDGLGPHKDFEFRPGKAMARVRSVKFTPTKDEGDKNSSRDIALSEILID